jgi:outer membrane receptor protein involved in Fe transport
MKRIGRILLTTIVFVMMSMNGIALAEETSGEAQEQEPVKKLQDVVVKERAGAPGVTLTPTETVIEVQKIPTIGTPNSIVDVLKGQAIIDFRGESEIDPGVDSVFMRGFDAKRFVTALDGLTVQKTGGRKSSNIVDYALMPAFLIDKVEILPGPHSALFDSKSIGGVINFKTHRPERRDSLRPDSEVTTSIGSYNTQTHHLMTQGAVRAVTYDIGYQKSASDGYLRHNKTDTDTVFGRTGVVLPSDGFLALSASYSDVDRDPPVTNTGADRDSGYPEVKKASFDPWQDPNWDGISHSLRLNYQQDTVVGLLNLGAYSSEDNRKRSYYVNEGDVVKTTMDTTWWQNGGKLQDEYRWSDAHVTTLGFDMAKLYDGHDGDKDDRITKYGGYLQHQWDLFSALEVRLGMRYENVAIRVSNTNGTTTHIPGRGQWIDRDWDQLIPKSFITWKMDPMAAWLRDTSLSLGVSKIWRAPDYHGDYNPQGRPAGAWLDPEHGMGYDVVLNRRLWRDISLKLNYAFYQIYDYIASNKSYAQYSGADEGALRYSDYKINLDEVHRHGVDVELGGHLTDALSFYLTYAWQTYDNQGDEPAGETELDQRAEHRVTAGLAFAFTPETTLMLDYTYQSEETTEISEQIAENVWYFNEVDNSAYQVFDLGIKQLIYQSERLLREAYLNAYVKNLFNEDYNSPDGYPASDRTVGVALNINF